MQDVVESLPLADDMREALVHRRGPLGELLNAAAAREQGESGGTTVPHADELYLRAVIWANTAAESLFGAGPGPASASTAPDTPTAPGAASAPAAPSAPVTMPKAGVVRRFFAGIGRLFGRRD